jgi:HprK-related kinase A
MRHSFAVKVGPRGFRIGSAWAEPIRTIAQLYRDYPKPDGDIPDHSVRLEAVSLLRRWIKPSVAIEGGYTLPEAAPLPLALGALASEMAMNLQVALGERHYLLLHAATVERDGKAVILTGESGSGKSTLSAVLMAKGWRLLGDEFALIDPASMNAYPFPRPISLKNKAVGVMEALLPPERFGPLMRDTPKGDIRHVIPDKGSIARMDEPARPVAIIFPSFGREEAVRPVSSGEVFVRLTQASTNYTALAETGFRTLTKLVSTIPGHAIDYPDTETGVKLVTQLWEETS